MNPATEWNFNVFGIINNYDMIYDIKINIMNIICTFEIKTLISVKNKNSSQIILTKLYGSKTITVKRGKVHIFKRTRAYKA